MNKKKEKTNTNRHDIDEYADIVHAILILSSAHELSHVGLPRQIKYHQVTIF